MAGNGDGGQGKGDGGQSKDIKELTSAVDKLLKDLGAQNTAAIDLIGGVVALIVATTPLGQVVAVVGILGSIISILSPSGSSQASLGQVSKQLAQLIQAESQEADTTRRTNIQNAISGAATIAGSLQDNANHLPLPTSEVTRQMQEILQSMNQLAPPDISGRGCQSAGNIGGPWEVPFNYQTKWTDADSPDTVVTVKGAGPHAKIFDVQVFRGYGEQDPPKDPSGQVFNYTYVLPAYVYAVSTFLSTGLLIDPNFQQDFSNNVATAVCLLQSVHDFVLIKGMKKLLAGPVTLQNLEKWSHDMAAAFGLAEVSGEFDGFPPSLPRGVFPEGPVEEPSGIRIEYGVIELFSGFSSMGIYTLAPFSALHQNINYEGAFQIRLERRAKDVYRGTGLKKLQETIDNFNKMIGQPTSTGPSPGDWSFRRDIVGPANVTRPDGTVHLSDIKAFLESTPPTPTQTPTPSFRHLLSL